LRENDTVIQGWSRNKLPRAGRKIVKIKAYRKTGRRMENNRLDWFRNCVLNGKNVNTVQAMFWRELPEHAWTGWAGRNDYATVEQKGEGGACWNKQEQKEYAGSERTGRTTQE
jgi:hypothetical protein